MELQQYEAVDPSDKEETQELIKKLTNVQIEENEPFSALGFDGLDEVEIVLAIESQFGTTLSDEEFHSIHSVADAMKVFEKYAPKQASQ
jgi:acyl carrier protein